MTQDANSSNPETKDGTGGESFRSRDVKREKNFPPTKVIIRRLPPSMTEEMFLDQISPVPENDYLYFVKADYSLGQYAFSRAYINFINRDDIFIFKEKFDGYVFVDGKGSEYPAVVEFAAFQKIPKKKSKKLDTKSGTIEQDPDYLEFLDNLQNPEVINPQSTETFLTEIENREREFRASGGVRGSTPLIEYLKQKKRQREEKREERKRRDIEKKRQKEEERRRRKAEKDKERERAKELSKDAKDKDKIEKGKAEPAVKLLLNPEREKSKELEKDAMQEGHTCEKGRQDGAYLRAKVQPAKEKYWEIERKRREEERCARRDKEREKKDREKPERDDQSRLTAAYGRSGSSQDKPKAGGAGSKSMEWNRERSERGQYRSGGAATRINQSKGKSYEKTRESIVKARGEVKSGASTSSTVQKDNGGEDLKDEAAGPENRAESVSVVDENDGGTEQTYSQGVPDDNAAEECDVQTTTSRERYPKERSSRDPRTERRIRNKDRPSIELYRPGMRRLSLQRNSPQKESSSSSPSPTTVQNAKGCCQMEDETREDKSIGSPECPPTHEIDGEMEGVEEVMEHEGEKSENEHGENKKHIVSISMDTLAAHVSRS